jgi:hypothetical protein
MDKRRGTPPDEIGTGLLELQRYLADQMAPMMVADSIEPLLTRPPELIVPVIQDWITDQRRIEGPALTVGDCLFHAVQRIYFLSQLQLIDKKLMSRYALGLGRLALDLCPEEQRELLRQNLANLGKQPLMSMDISTRPQRRNAACVEGASADEIQRQRRFSLLIDRLQRQSGTQIQTQEHLPDAGPSLRERVVAASAVGSNSEAEFSRYRQQLAETGIDTRTEQVFRSLARTVPGWTLPESAGQHPDLPDDSESRALGAMRRIITNADVAEGSKRFGEMVEAAIQRFNAGSLPQAHKMFRLAQSLVDDGKVRKKTWKTVKTHADDLLAPDALMRFAEDTGRRHLLRHILVFFPRLEVNGLLSELAEADTKERRKLILVLLEVHGSRARPAIVKSLQSCVDDPAADPEGFLKRNLVSLLRRVPRAESTPPDREIDLLNRLLERGMPIFVTKETVGVLGQLRHPKADQALRDLLRDVEEQLANDASEIPQELLALLDRTVAALARFGSSEAVRSVLKHSNTQEPRLGTPFARLKELGSTDLSKHPDALQELLRTLKRALPGRVLGLVGFRRRDHVLTLIRALSGTPDGAVIEQLGAIGQRYPDEDFGQLAHETIRSLQARSISRQSAAPGLAGDLDTFDLSGLLQTLAGSERTGVLTLLDQDTVEVGELTFAAGRITAARAGHLQDRAAVYQLFERPVPGTFAFRRRPSAKAEQPAEDQEELDVMPLMMEGIRRYDELQHAIVLVPDDMQLARTGTKPSRPEHEEDRQLLRALWKRVIDGETPVACEAGLPVDSYRIRCAIAHWLEEGALKPA